LVEALIVAGVVAIATAGVYKFYSTVQAREQSHQESQNLLQVTNNVLRAYSAMPNFSGVSNARLVTEALLPSGMEVLGSASNPTIGSLFGSTLTVAPMTLDGNVGGGLVLTYSGVPRKNCAQFVANASAGYNFRDITVNDQNVLGTNRSLDQARVSAQCNSGPESTVTFTVQHGVQGTAALAAAACTVPASSPETQTVSCPSGYAGSITQTRTATCPFGAALPVWSEWSVISNTCVQVCTADPSSPQTRTSTPCPSGQIGTITERRVSTCATGQTTGSPTWSAWTVISNTCAPQCIVPADETRSPGCPTGQSGVLTERRSATCPLPTGTPVWGPWTTLTNTCVQNCVVPSPNPEIRWVQTSGSCGTGYSGTKYWEVEQRRTASCPTLTGSVAYTAWENTGNTRNEDATQCVSLCKPDEVLERWVAKEGACATGYVGSQSWEARETRTSFCPAGALNPTTSAWTATGETRNLVNDCQAASCVISAGTQYTWRQAGNQYDCSGTVSATTTVASGDTLNVSGSAQISSAGFNFRATGGVKFLCTAGTLSATPTSATCLPASCNVSSSSLGVWSTTPYNADIMCEAPYSSSVAAGGFDAFSVAVGSSFTVRDTTGDVQGTMALACTQTTNPTLGQVASVVETGTKSCVGSCANTPKPAPITRNYAGCASGYYGTWAQEDQYESSAFPQCWANTVASWTPATAPAGACVKCPTPVVETQWGVTTDGVCAAGQYGSTDREKEQSRTKSYVCPANTATLPAPTYTAWSDTGNTRVTTNNCANCPADKQELQWVVASPTATCPAGQAGTIGQEVEQSRTKSYACPAGTLTLPAPSYSTWTNTGNTRPTVNNCVVCPAPEVETEVQWVTTVPGSCATGQYGQIGQQKEQVRTRTKTYSCPAGTATMPAPAYTAWSAWTDSGKTREVTSENSCTACPASLVEKQWVSTTNGSCAAGSWGSITQEKEQSRTKSYNCPAGTVTLPAPTYTAWTDTGVTRQTGTSCVACPAPVTETELQWVATTTTSSCAAGQWGGVAREKEQKRTRTISYACPAGTTSLPAPTYSAWSSWTDTGNTRDKVGGNTCTACPATTTETQWIATTNGTCAAGSWGYTSRDKEQSRTKSYNCPAGTASLPAPTYSAWTDTGNTRQTASSCTVCPSASTENESQWIATTNGSCATGQWGTIAREKEQTRSRSVTYSCPAGTLTLPAPTYGTWSSWTDSGNTRDKAGGNSCTACPSASSETQWVATTNGACATGQWGTIAREKEQTRTKSYSCPAGTTSLPAPTYSAWTDTGTTRDKAGGNTCTACPTSTTETELQWVTTTSGACSAGQWGGIAREKEQKRTRTVSYSCPAGTTSLPTPTYSAWSSWTDTGTTRDKTGGNTCTACPTATTETQWIATTSGTCAAGQWGTIAREKEQSRTKSYSCPAGTASLPAPSYTAWADTGATRDKTGGNTCTACPSATVEKQWVATTNGTCASGQWGSTTREKEQSRTKSYTCPAGSTSLPSPSYTTWTDTGVTRVTGGACTACPSTTSTTVYRWVATTNQLCASGQYGSITREKQQQATQTTSYSCPAGTLSLPSPTVTTGAWTDTGTTRNTGGSCTACPSPTTAYNWVARSAACPAGQTGSNTWEAQQSQTTSYNCPAGTTSLPSPSTTAWTDTGSIRNQVNTCKVTANPCVVSTTISRTWTDPYSGQTCGTPLTGLGVFAQNYIYPGTYASGAVVSLFWTKTSAKFGDIEGSANAVCNNGTWVITDPVCTYTGPMGFMANTSSGGSCDDPLTPYVEVCP